MRRYLLLCLIFLLVACSPDVVEVATAVPTRTPISATATVLPTNPPPPTVTAVSTMTPVAEIALKQPIPIAVKGYLVTDYLRAIYETENGWIAQDLDIDWVRIASYLPETGKMLFVSSDIDGLYLNTYDFQTRETITWVEGDVIQGKLLPNQDAFVYWDRETSNLHLLDETSDSHQLLAENSSEFIAVSPDGNSVAFERPQGDRGLFLLDLATGVETKLWDGVRAEDDYANSHEEYELPMWSTTGEQVMQVVKDHGTIWAARDGSFAYFYEQNMLEERINADAVKDRNRTLCLAGPAMFADNMMVNIVAPCNVEHSYMAGVNLFRPRTHLVVFHLNPENGDIENMESILHHGEYIFAAWDVPGESVLLLHRDDLVESIPLNTAQTANADYVTCRPIMMGHGHYQPNPFFVHDGNVYDGVHSDPDPLNGTPLLDFGDVTSFKQSDKYEFVYTRAPDEDIVELWWRDFDFENHLLASFSITDYLTSAPDGVVAVTFAFEWLPHSNKMLLQFEPQLDALGRLPLQRPTIFDLETKQELDLTAYGDVYQVAFAAGGEQIALVVDQQLLIVDTGSGQIAQQITMDTSKAHDQTVSFSPNGRFLAAFEPGGLLIVDRATTTVKRVPLSFTDVGLGHYAAWPVIHWLNDGTTIRTMLSESEDVFSPSASFTVWDVDAETAVATPQQTYNGNVVAAEFAPDANYLAYVARHAEAGNKQRLMIANLYNQTESEYAIGKVIQFGGWNPNGAHFTYRADGETMQLGHICQEPQALFPSPSTIINEVMWLDEQFYLAATDGEPQDKRDNGIWDISIYMILEGR